MNAPGLSRERVAGAVARGAQWLDYDDTTFAARLAVSYLISRWRSARRSAQSGSFAQGASAEPGYSAGRTDADRAGQQQQQVDPGRRCLWADKDQRQQDQAGNTSDQSIRTPFARHGCTRPVGFEGSERACISGCP